MKTFQLDKRRWPLLWFQADGRSHPQLARREAGFTLLELIMTMVIGGVLVGLTAQMLISGANTFEYVTARKEGLENSRMAMQRVLKEVRQAMDPGMIQKATNDSLRYVNIDNQSVQLRYINQSILLNGQSLIDNVTQFDLFYFDGSGGQLAFPITNTGNIWRIRVSFVYSNDGQSISLQQDIVPRNFRN